MSDKFEDITDDEMEAEIRKRDLEMVFTEEVQGYLDDLGFEYDILSTQLEREQDISPAIDELCNSYQYKSDDEFSSDAKQFLIDHGGLIA